MQPTEKNKFLGVEGVPIGDFWDTATNANDATALLPLTIFAVSEPEPEPEPDPLFTTTPVDKLKITYNNSTGIYEFFLIVDVGENDPEADGEIRDKAKVLSSTVYTSGTAGGTSAMLGLDLNGDNMFSNTDTYLAQGSTILSTTSSDPKGDGIILPNVQSNWNKLHRLTWFKENVQFDVGTDWKVMQIKSTDPSTKLVGKMTYYYGDHKNAPFIYRKYNITFADDSTTPVSIAVDMENGSPKKEEIPPLRKYYVRLTTGLGVTMPDSPYYEFSDTKVTSSESFSAKTGTLDLYKGATYIFERTNDVTTVGDNERKYFPLTGVIKHPFHVKEKTSSAYVKIQNSTLPITSTSSKLSNDGDQMLVFIDWDYKETTEDNLLEYYCTSHPSMKGDFKILNQNVTDPDVYEALVPTTRSIESGNNIKLEIEGEEIIL